MTEFGDWAIEIVNDVLWVLPWVAALAALPLIVIAQGMYRRLQHWEKYGEPPPGRSKFWDDVREAEGQAGVDAASPGFTKPGGTEVVGHVDFCGRERKETSK
jgi:hypothetical protein